MNAAIGQLSSGKFYSYINGYNAEPFIGSLEEVEVAMGIREKVEPAKVANVEKKAKTYSVKLTFQYPAWDEVDGIDYHGIEAESKADANAQARRMAGNDGHLCGGKGRVTFTATEQ